MKKEILYKLIKESIFVVFLLFSITKISATVQRSDFLIIKNDTIELKSFLLEKLDLKKRPFNLTRNTAPSTDCWRGYRAYWKILDKKLYLEKIVKCDSKDEQNLTELFNSNNIEFDIIQGMILSDWVTVDLFSVKLINERIYLYDSWNGKNKEKDLKLKIESGEIKINQFAS